MAEERPELLGILGRLQNRLLGTIIGTSVGFAGSQVFQPFLRPLGYRFEQAVTNVVLVPGQLAEAVVRNVVAYEDAKHEAQASGISGGRFDALIQSTSRPPGFADILALWRRGPDHGGLTEAEAREALFFSDVKDRYVGPLLSLRRVLNSADDLAQMAVQGILSQDEAAALARLQGTEREEFDRLYRLHGEPPGMVDMLSLWNRHVIDEGEFERSYRQSRLKPEWMEKFKALRFHLESPAELIRFLVREVYTPEIRQRFRQDEDYPDAADEQGHRLGISPTLMRDYWAAHWELPSVEQGFSMFHRREPGGQARIIDRETLNLLMRAKDVMPWWRDKLVQIAFRVPGRIDLRREFVAGIIDADELEAGYRDLGYGPEHAHRLRLLGMALKQAPEKDLSKAEIVAEYEARMIGRAAALERVKGLGYSEQEASAIIDLAEYRARKSFRNAVIGVVRSRFVDREIDRAVATERLDRIGVPPEGRDELLELWTFQQAESPTRLTEAQLRAALKAKVIEEPEYRAGVAQLGYEAHSIDVLTQLATR